MSDTQVIVITGASSGFGNLAARAPARTGHTVGAADYDGQYGSCGKAWPRA